MTARCVLPKQNKPCIPIFGMSTDGLGFYSSHFAKPLSRKPKRSFIGLVTVMEGLISAEDLERRTLVFISHGAKLGKLPSAMPGS